MKKIGSQKIAAFLLALLLSASLSVTDAFAANDTGTAVIQTNKSDSALQFKSEVVRLVNIEREKAGVAVLTTLDALYPPADVRAKESATQFKHTRLDGSRCFTIFAEYGLKYRAAGENLAYGFATPADVVTAWMNSPSHRQNILDPDFSYIGIGYFVKENGSIYVSQLFYTPR
jgi:uncharacterized protein YkwD